MSADERIGSGSRAELAGQLALAGGRMTLDRFEGARGGGAKDATAVAEASAVHTVLAAGIARAFPDDGIVTGEDRLADGLPPGRYTWIVVDTGDGDDLERRLPGCSVSLGVLRGRMPFAGAVYDPVTRPLFSACVGRGAWLNDRPLYAGRGMRDDRWCRFGSIALVSATSRSGASTSFVGSACR